MTDLNDKLKTWPAEIWLQHGVDWLPNYAEVCGWELTWCADNINANDVRYVRADLAAAPASLTPAPQGTASGLTDARILEIAAEQDYGDEDPKCITRLARAFEKEIAASLTQAATSEPVATAKQKIDAHTTSYHQGYMAGIEIGKALAAEEAAPAAAHPAPSVKTRLPKLPRTLYEEYPAMSAQAHEAAVKEYARAALSAQQAGVQEAPMLKDNRRALFEKMVIDNETHYTLSNDVQRYEEGYVRHTVDIAWWAWKAALSASSAVTNADAKFAEAIVSAEWCDEGCCPFCYAFGAHTNHAHEEDCIVHAARAALASQGVKGGEA
jgi:hypothetical protein